MRAGILVLACVVIAIAVVSVDAGFSGTKGRKVYDKVKKGESPADEGDRKRKEDLDKTRETMPEPLPEEIRSGENIPDDIMPPDEMIGAAGGKYATKRFQYQMQCATCTLLAHELHKQMMLDRPPVYLNAKEKEKYTKNTERLIGVIEDAEEATRTKYNFIDKNEEVAGYIGSYMHFDDLVESGRLTAEQKRRAELGHQTGGDSGLQRFVREKLITKYQDDIQKMIKGRWGRYRIAERLCARNKFCQNGKVEERFFPTDKAYDVLAAKYAKSTKKKMDTINAKRADRKAKRNAKEAKADDTKSEDL
jgi:hypothetical protein